MVPLIIVTNLLFHLLKKKIKIKYVKSNYRIGKSKMDNILFPLVSGKYQCYCGSDDYFKKNAFKEIFYC